MKIIIAILDRLLETDREKEALQKKLVALEQELKCVLKRAYEAEFGKDKK